MRKKVKIRFALILVLLVFVKATIAASAGRNEDVIVENTYSVNSYDHFGQSIEGAAKVTLTYRNDTLVNIVFTKGDINDGIYKAADSLTIEVSNVEKIITYYDGNRGSYLEIMGTSKEWQTLNGETKEVFQISTPTTAKIFSDRLEILGYTVQLSQLSINEQKLL